MREEELKVSLEEKQELVKKAAGLKGLEKRYYDFIPVECFMTEVNQAKALKTTRHKIQKVKKSLSNKGLIHLETRKNGKRKNPKHQLTKIIPILELMEGELYDNRFLLEDNYYDFNYLSDTNYLNIQNNNKSNSNYASYKLNLDLLTSVTAAEINKMDKLELVQFYMDCGFIVLPTHYPIFTEQGVKCSCRSGYMCSHKGKHPKPRYRYLNPSNYETLKESFLDQFRKNPNLNIGFKVIGFSVLDIDYRHNGHKTLEKLKYEFGIEFKGITASKSGGGEHIYASNTNLKNVPRALGDGLDIRSDRGFIVAPGSSHYSGNTYQWQHIGELAYLPDEWLKKSEISVSTESKTGASNKTTSEKLKDIKLPAKLTSDYVIPEGERELTLYKWGCRKRGSGSDEKEIYDFLISIRDTFCDEGDEPVTDEEIILIAKSAVGHPTEAQKKAGLALRY